MTDVVALAAELLAIESPTLAEGPAVEFVARRLIARGWNVTVQEVTPGRGNVWASRRGGGVTLSTHLDTVAPFVPPRMEGDRLRGRGAADAKGIAAAMLTAADRLVDEGEERLDLLFVVGAGRDSDGARAANLLPATSRWLVIGGPTGGRLATGAKGSLRVTLCTRGRAAHSACAHLGHSAIVPLVELISTLGDLRLPTDPLLGETTVNVGTIRGGSEAGVVPDRAEAELLFRLVGPVEEMRAAVEGWVAGRAEIGWGSTIPAHCFQTIGGYEAAAVSYTTDAPLLGNWGTPLLLGPGSIEVAHAADEHMDVHELRAAVDAYARLVRALLDG